MNLYRYLHHQWMVTRAEIATIVILTTLVVALLGYTRPLGVIPATNQTIVHELATTPPLATATDICLDPASTFAHFVVDDHYEADLAQNEGQVNAVRYHLFFRLNPELDVIIEESRTGTLIAQRTDPNTPEFRACVAKKKVVEVRPQQ